MVLDPEKAVIEAADLSEEEVAEAASTREFMMITSVEATAIEAEDPLEDSMRTTTEAMVMIEEVAKETLESIITTMTSMMSTDHQDHNTEMTLIMRDPSEVAETSKIDKIDL